MRALLGARVRGGYQVYEGHRTIRAIVYTEPERLRSVELVVKAARKTRSAEDDVPYWRPLPLEEFKEFLSAKVLRNQSQPSDSGVPLRSL